ATVIGIIGTAGGNGAVIEFAGNVIEGFSIEARNVWVTTAFHQSKHASQATCPLKLDRPMAPKDADWDAAVAYWKTLKSDTGAKYDSDFQINAIIPTITWGTSPEDTVAINESVPDPTKVSDPTKKQFEWRRAQHPVAPIETPSITTNGVSPDSIVQDSRQSGHQNLPSLPPADTNVPIYSQTPATQSGKANVNALVEKYNAMAAECDLPNGSNCLNNSNNKRPADAITSLRALPAAVSTFASGVSSLDGGKDHSLLFTAASRVGPTACYAESTSEASSQAVVKSIASSSIFVASDKNARVGDSLVDFMANVLAPAVTASTTVTKLETGTTSNTIVNAPNPVKPQTTPSSPLAIVKTLEGMSLTRNSLDAATVVDIPPMHSQIAVTAGSSESVNLTSLASQTKTHPSSPAQTPLINVMPHTSSTIADVVVNSQTSGQEEKILPTAIGERKILVPKRRKGVTTTNSGCSTSDGKAQSSTPAVAVTATSLVTADDSETIAGKEVLNVAGNADPLVSTLGGDTSHCVEADTKEGIDSVASIQTTAAAGSTPPSAAYTKYNTSKQDSTNPRSSFAAMEGEEDWKDFCCQLKGHEPSAVACSSKIHTKSHLSDMTRSSHSKDVDLRSNNKFQADVADTEHSHYVAGFVTLMNGSETTKAHLVLERKTPDWYLHQYGKSIPPTVAVEIGHDWVVQEHCRVVHIGKCFDKLNDEVRWAIGFGQRQDTERAHLKEWIERIVADFKC
ncbi:UNVERIFIED_CONTAM: 3-isopropylmalate dehydratase, partial [Siphonaria sp. JEL0065]